jgi:hypothetical protein
MLQLLVFIIMGSVDGQGLTHILHLNMTKAVSYAVVEGFVGAPSGAMTYYTPLIPIAAEAAPTKPILFYYPA